VCAPAGDMVIDWRLQVILRALFLLGNSQYLGKSTWKGNMIENLWTESTAFMEGVYVNRNNILTLSSNICRFLVWKT
jgi:hypothetical protein